MFVQIINACKTLFKPVIVICGTHNIMQNILHIQLICMMIYSAKYGQSHQHCYAFE